MKRNILITIAALLLISDPLVAQIITTFAGNHLVGDSGPATAANIYPGMMTGDPFGNLYVSEWNTMFACRVRKISSAGTITTIAGDTTMGYSGDGGPATAAQLMLYDGSMATDGAGNIYVADNFNYCIRKIDALGIMTTVCGTGTPGYSGDGGPAAAAQIGGWAYSAGTDNAGNVYIVDNENFRIRKIDLSGIITTIAGTGIAGDNGDGGLATSAAIMPIGGVVADGAGNIFFCQQGFKIRKVSAAGIISTIAGTGAVGFTGDGGPASLCSFGAIFGMSMDVSGNLYVCDAGNQRIRKINTAGIINTIAGNGTAGFSGDGGPAISAALNAPTSCYADALGNVFLGDAGNLRVRKIDAGGMISTVAGNGSAGYNGEGLPATGSRMFSCVDVCAGNSGNKYVSEQLSCMVRKVDASGIATRFAGNGSWGFSGDGGPATAATFAATGPVAEDNAGNVYIGDLNNYCIRKVNTAGIISTIAGIPGSFGFSGDGGPAIAAQMSGATGIVVNAAGEIYLLTNARVRKINTAGIISTLAGDGSWGYSGEGVPATSVSLGSADDLAVDQAGNLYIADGADNIVRKVSTSGIINTIAGTPGVSGHSGDGGPATAAVLRYPAGLVLDTAGNLYVTDAENNDVRKITPDGIITTFAGNGGRGYYGDGGLAVNAMLNYPIGIAIDNAGKLYIADMSNSVVRVVYIPDFMPYFAGGHIRSLSLCTYGATLVLDTLLAVVDTNAGQHEVWTIVQPPLHGIATGADSTIATGDTLTPSGFGYTPFVGYNGTDSLKIMISDGIVSNVMVIYITAHAPPALAAGSNSPLCTGDTLMLYANKDTVTPYNYLWNGPGGFTSVVQFPLLYSTPMSMAGSYTVTASDSFCTSVRTTEVIIYPYVVLTNVTPIQVIAPGASVRLNAEGGVYYYWSPGDGSLTNPNINNPVAQPVATTVYTVVSMNQLGCGDTATVQVIVNDADAGAFVPTAFTPNGDGVNDIFRIRLNGYKVDMFAIYNRWGEVVYNGVQNNNEGWNGDYKGVPQDMGTYNYLVVLSDARHNARTLKGTVNLIR